MSRVALLCAVVICAVVICLLPAASLPGQSLMEPRATKPTVPSDPAGIIRMLRTEWGLLESDVGGDDASHARVGDDLTDNLTDSRTVVANLVAEVHRALKLIETSNRGDDGGMVIKKAAALAEARVRNAVDDLLRSESSAEQAGENVRIALSEYLRSLEDHALRGSRRS